MLLKRAIIKLIKFYQKNISVNKPARCRYYPTCSEYGLQSVEEHGVLVGVILTIKRILRCNPFFRGGYDPVPERKAKKDKKGLFGG